MSIFSVIIKASLHYSRWIYNGKYIKQVYSGNLSSYPRDLHRDAAFKFNKTLFIIVRHSNLPKICNGGFPEQTVESYTVIKNKKLGVRKYIEIKREIAEVFFF